MEVVVPVPAVDFNFDSACSSPYMTAPSSPQRFGNFYFSAPTSPTRASSFYRQFNDLTATSTSSIPFKWEERPGVPKTNNNNQNQNQNQNQNLNDVVDDDVDFAFDFSGQLERTSVSADELFDGGKIKPLKPPPRLQLGEFNDSPKSPRSPVSHRKKTTFRDDFDPFAAAIEQQTRGRERVYNSSSSSSVRKGSRSLSPLRVSDDQFSMERVCDQQSEKTSTTMSSSNWAWKGYRKWRLKDLLLFRSASEGRATTAKDPLRKYTALSKKSEDVKNSSFRSTDSAGSVSRSRRRGPVSAHELHYTVNRAVSEEMRRKTFLPYKRGLLGCLGFNPAVHEISRGFGL